MIDVSNISALGLSSGGLLHAIFGASEFWLTVTNFFMSTPMSGRRLSATERTTHSTRLLSFPCLGLALLKMSNHVPDETDFGADGMGSGSTGCLGPASWSWSKCVVLRESGGNGAR